MKSMQPLSPKAPHSGSMMTSESPSLDPLSHLTILIYKIFLGFKSSVFSTEMIKCALCKVVYRVHVLNLMKF